MTEAHNRQFKESKWISRLAWLFVLVGFAFLLDGFSVLKSPATLDQLGNLGSYYQGTVASFWALAGLLFIYETLRAQKEQLRTQQKQIADEEKSQKRRDFESAFFQLLNFQNQMAEQLSETTTVDMFAKPPVKKTKSGRQCFVVWANYFESWVTNAADQNKLNKNDIAQVLTLYEAFYGEKQSYLGHYFRTVYHVFKFCNESGIPEKEVRRYTSLARAQLSGPELFLLFYNGLSPNGFEKFKPLIEKFGLLEHLDKQRLFHPSHKNLYAPAAYQ